MERRLYRLRALIRAESALLTLALAAIFSVTAKEAGRLGWNTKPGRPRVCDLAYASAAPRRLPPEPGPTLVRKWRASFNRSLAEKPGSELVRGMFLGDASALSPETHELFRRLGLTHLLAASGFNCWIVAIAFTIGALTGLRLVAFRLPARFLLLARPRIAVGAQVLGAWLFWAWSDRSPPITRAAVMVTAKALIAFVELQVPFLRLLLVLYLLSLAFVPALWRSPSFQLTYGCLVGVALLPRLLSSWAPAAGLRRSVWDYAWSSFGASLGALPTTWLFFGEINFTGLLTNWFAVPPVSLLIMPLALVLMLLCAPGLFSLENTGLELVRQLLAAASAFVASMLLWLMRLWDAYLPTLLLQA